MSESVDGQRALAAIGKCQNCAIGGLHIDQCVDAEGKPDNEYQNCNVR